MKIVQICLCGPYNSKLGYQDNILPKYYVKLGLECTTVAGQYYNEGGNIVRSTTPRVELENGSTLIRIPNLFNLPHSINNYLRLYKGIYKILKAENPDIIFLHNFQFLSYRSIIKYCKKHPNVTLYADSHTDYINSGRNWLSLHVLHKRVWKHCTKKLEPYVKKFWGVTEQRCEFMENVYSVSKEKVELLVMGADVDKINFAARKSVRDKIRNQLRISQEDFMVVSGGKIDKLKNIEILVGAMKTIRDPNVKLVLFGSISSEMESLLREMKNDERIKFIGWLDSDKVYDYFLAADLAVFPGTHSVLWEQAVGTGIPCIFKKWTGMTHVDVGGNCKFVTEDSASALAECITTTMDHETYKRMDEIAKQEGVRRFSYYEIARASIEFS